MSNGEAPLRRDATTGRDHPVELLPFRVVHVECPARWDAGREALPLRYEVVDRNRRIVSGRIRYVTTLEGEITLHTQRLTPDQFAQGPHELLPAQRWDGTITEGLDGSAGRENRIGQRVTADLCPLAAIVEVWNNANPAPGRRLERTPGQPPPQRGRTDVPGEWLAAGVDTTDLDAFARATWERNWCIPFGDLDEPDKGYVFMNIEVRNVADGTPVRIEVLRTGDPADPETDHWYADSSVGPDDQPGLQHLVVRRGRVVREPPPGTSSSGSGSSGRRRRRQPAANERRPYVLMNNYDEHWVHPGNNFYAFRVAFGPHGLALIASERDYVGRERDCLHMRFTVFIHCSASDADYVGGARDLHDFFRNRTRYYRSYLLRGSPRSMAQYVDYFSYRYMVFIEGHASVRCEHRDHPDDAARNDKMDLYHRGFAPDLNTCPTGVEDTDQGRRELQWADRTYRRPFGGCGHREEIWHAQRCGNISGQRFYLINPPPRAPVQDAPLLLMTPTRRAPVQSQAFPLGPREPRLLLYTGGCRTMLSNNLGAFFTNSRTRYFHGWIWSVWIRENRQFQLAWVRRWIQGTAAEPAPNEWDVSRLLPAYRAVADGPGISSHPRLMESGRVLNVRPAPNAAEEALE